MGYVSPQDIASSNISKFTHVIFSSVSPASATDPTVVMANNMSWSLLTQFSNTAHSLGVKAMVTFYVGNNNELGNLINRGLVNQVVANITNILATYNLDGVDIDWESGEPQSAMSTFLDALGPAVHTLPGNKIVVAAASWYRYDISLAEVNAGNIDFIMPMCYDLYRTTIPNNHIADPGFNISEYNGYTYTTTGAKSSYADTVGIMKMWIAGGFPTSKLLPGIFVSQTDPMTSTQIAKWTVNNGLAGNMIFTVNGTNIVSAVYNVLSTFTPTSSPLSTFSQNPSPTPASTFGLNQGDKIYTEAANRIDALRFQNTVGSGTLTQLELKFNQISASGRVRMGVYADNDGSVGNLLLDAGEVPAGIGWTGISGLDLPVTAKSYYWLAFSLSDANTIEYQSFGQPTGCHVADESIAYGPLPETFPVTWSGNTPYVMRATLKK